MSFEELLEQMSEGVNDPAIFKAVFLAGGPGSGKSWVTRGTTGGLGFKVLNSDSDFERMMKDAKLSLDMTKLSPEELDQKDDIRGHAKDLAAKRWDLTSSLGLGLVIDGTGRDRDNITQQRKYLEALGYDTLMIFVNTSLEVALQRNKSRERKVPEDLVKKFWMAVQQNMGYYQKEFGSQNFIIIDNNDATEDVLAKSWVKIMKYSKRPIRNHIGLKWIAYEKARRGIK